MALYIYWIVVLGLAYGMTYAFLRDPDEELPFLLVCYIVVLLWPAVLVVFIVSELAFMRRNQ